MTSPQFRVLELPPCPSGPLREFDYLTQFSPPIPSLELPVVNASSVAISPSATTALELDHGVGTTGLTEDQFGNYPRPLPCDFLRDNVRFFAM